MTPEEFEQRMKAIAGAYAPELDDPNWHWPLLDGPWCYEAEDPEQAHADADQMMCDVLRHLGYGAGVDVFLKMLKWYA